MTFEVVKTMGDWGPIRDCPGRYVLRGVSPALNVAELLGGGVTIQQFRSPKAIDAVFVVHHMDGGTISYRRSPDAWRHTLCTQEGFERKLAQMEIVLQEPDA